ncbi:YrhB domain-containing protein [Streptomyces sp. NPDC057445]|uniref:YrhB domain-containing protein n=1 Tax=Streptomyces sp. NPDC057445 TaxID=3346136 RepID=UPI00369B72D8
MAAGPVGGTTAERGRPGGVPGRDDRRAGPAGHGRAGGARPARFRPGTSTGPTPPPDPYRAASDDFGRLRTTSPRPSGRRRTGYRESVQLVDPEPADEVERGWLFAVSTEAFIGTRRPAARQARCRRGRTEGRGPAVCLPNSPPGPGSTHGTTAPSPATERSACRRGPVTRPGSRRRSAGSGVRLSRHRSTPNGSRRRTSCRPWRWVPVPCPGATDGPQGSGVGRARAHRLPVRAGYRDGGQLGVAVHRSQRAGRRTFSPDPVPVITARSYGAAQ